MFSFVLWLLVPLAHLHDSWIYTLPYQLVVRLSDSLCYDSMLRLEASLINLLPEVGPSALV